MSTSDLFDPTDDLYPEPLPVPLRALQLAVEAVAGVARTLATQQSQKDAIQEALQRVEDSLAYYGDGKP